MNAAIDPKTIYTAVSIIISSVVAPFIGIVVWLVNVKNKALHACSLSEKNEEDIEMVRRDIDRVERALAVQEQKLFEIGRSVDRSNELLEKNNDVTLKLSTAISGLSSDIRNMNTRISNVEKLVKKS